MVLAHMLTMLTRFIRAAADSFADARRLRRELGRRFQTEE